MLGKGAPTTTPLGFGWVLGGKEGIGSLIPRKE